MYHCNKCDTDKDESEFHPSRIAKHNYMCKVCEREYQRKRMGSFERGTPEYYERMKAAGKKQRKPPLDKIERDVAQATTTTCRLLRTHELILKDDPERLTVGFMKNIIGSKDCD